MIKLIDSTIIRDTILKSDLRKNINNIKCKMTTTEFTDNIKI